MSTTDQNAKAAAPTKTMTAAREAELRRYFEPMTMPCGCVWLGKERSEWCAAHNKLRDGSMSVKYDVASDFAAAWRVLGIDPAEAIANHCWLAPSIQSTLSDVANSLERIATKIPAARKELQPIIDRLRRGEIE